MRLIRTVATSEADTIGAASSPDVDQAQELVMVTVHYSAAPTQAGVTVTLNSGAGAGYDTLLTTGTANAQNTVYLPSAPLFIAPDDVIDVSAPAGGGVITSSISIYTRPV
jgi:hypothetical protein